MEWLYRYTDGHSSKILFPKVLRYFMDPLEIIRRHPGYKFNPNTSKLESLFLGDVYRYMHDKDLARAHNSRIDDKTQTDWDKKHSVRYFFDMWKAKTIKNSNEKVSLIDLFHKSGILTMRFMHGNYHMLTRTKDLVVDRHMGYLIQCRKLQGYQLMYLRYFLVYFQLRCSVI